MDSFVSSLITICLALLVILFFLKPKKTSTKGAKLPPGPPRLPIIGNLHQLGKLPHQTLCQLAQNYGPAMQLQLGSIPALVITSPEMAMEVLKTKDLHFCSRPQTSGAKKFSYNFIDVGLSPYGDHWREMRKLFVSEITSVKRAQAFRKAREAEVDRLMDSLHQASAEGKPISLDEAMFAVIDGIIGAFALGKSYCGKQYKGKNLKDYLNESKEVLSAFAAEDYFPSIGWIAGTITGRRARIDRCFNNFDGYIEMILDEHLDPARSKPEQDDFVDALIALSKEQSGPFPLTKNHIKALLMTTFLAAIDTTAVTTVWAMSEIVRKPRVMQKLQAEIRDCVGNKPRVEVDDLPKMAYLRMVIKETLRLHPPAPLLVPRECRSHCKIGGTDGTDGYDVFPGTRVYVNAWAIARDPKNWNNPLEFDPDRFEGSDIDLRGQHFQLLSFGSGRRSCSGTNMAIGTLEFNLASLLHSFDWELPSGMNPEDIVMEEEGGISLHKITPLYLVPIKHEF